MSGGCKCRLVYVQRDLEIEANAIISECNKCYRVGAGEIIRDNYYILLGMF